MYLPLWSKTKKKENHLLKVHAYRLGTFKSPPPPTNPYEADGNTRKKSFRHYNKDKDPDFRYVKNWRGELIMVPKRTDKYQERKYLGKFAWNGAISKGETRYILYLLHDDDEAIRVGRRRSFSCSTNIYYFRIRQKKSINIKIAWVCLVFEETEMG